jgi:DNA-binding transcriptional LysR family regulator
MKRDEAGDLLAFMAVAEEGSFTRAAAKLATSQSALSHTVRKLETRLGLRLLTRTTRSVALTEAGERLLRTIGPAFAEIDGGVAALSELRDKPAGTIRMTTSEHAAHTVLWPVIGPLLHSYPDLNVELVIDSGLTDIVAERLDAGVRLGESIAKDMVAARIGPELRMAVVGSPAYFAAHPRPKAPQDLAEHRCNNVRMIVRAAIDGLGLACVLEDVVAEEMAAGRLIRVLGDWCPPFAGYHLYYPSRRQPSAAFALIVEALRYR